VREKIVISETMPIYFRNTASPSPSANGQGLCDSRTEEISHTLIATLTRLQVHIT